MKNLFFLDPLKMEIILLFVTAKGRYEDVGRKLQGHIDQLPGNWTFDTLEDAEFKRDTLFELGLA